jgi:radical SAM superfamily enzyme YgiQ (UPF0313 family)
MPCTIYFADLTHCGTITNADTFPLGVGSIAAYTKQQFGDEVLVDVFKFPHDLNAALAANVPDILCLSNYTWSFNLTMEFARYVRAEHPEVVIVMGGPNIDITPEGRKRFLQKNDCVDFYVKFEGEYGFCGLARRLFEYDLDAAKMRSDGIIIDNVLYLETVDKSSLVEGVEKRIADIMTLPSPYTMGIMDKFFDQGLRPLVEFTRGCPYSCTFCTDSHAHRNKVMRRSTEYARTELEYIASHMKHASDLIIADLNFGMYQEDLEVAKILRSMIDRDGWPKAITASPGKSQPARVGEVVGIINGKGRGIIKFGASMQSTDPEVLKAISRKNLPADRVKDVVNANQYDEDFTEYFTELILGLPGDTKEKHYQSLRDMIDKLGMNVVNVHQLAILQGAPMALENYQKTYGFELRHRVFVGCIGTYQVGSENKPIAEFEEVVVANKTMDYQTWLECRVMNLLVKIYIDRDYFVEVFGLIRRLGLSPVDLLDHLRTAIIPRFETLSNLVELFLQKTEEPLYGSKEELLDFVNNPDVVAKYESGELGGNELLIHRAMAYMECNDDLHTALKDAALAYLEEAGELNELMVEYVSQATQFSQLRKFNPMNYTQELSGEFNFDFVNSKKIAYQVLPNETKIASKEIRFFFNEIAGDEIEYAMRTWVNREGTRRERQNDTSETSNEIDFQENALTKFNFGKLFHYSNLRVMNRSAEFVP